MARIKKTRYVILGLLMHQNLSGYEIKKKIELHLQYFWSESFGQIYPALQELEQAGMILQVLQEDCKNEKKIYQITEKGRIEFADYFQKPVEEEKSRCEILLKTYFGSHQSKSELEKHLQDFKRRMELNLVELEQYHQCLQQNLDEADHLFYLMTVKCGKRIYQAYYFWAEETLELLKQI